MVSNEFIPGVVTHSELNPLLWQGNSLRREVKQALMQIARRFYQFLAVDAKVIDVIVTGSQAGKTYTDQSDLDLHLIMNYAEIACDDQTPAELLDTKRKLWKLEHSIHIHTVPVECYAEDLNRPVQGASYSLIKNSWIKESATPQGQPADVTATTTAWCRVITAALRTRDLEQMQRVRSLLKTYRQLGLDLEGELGRANITFKTLRNMGVISSLIQSIQHQQDQELSLPD